MTRAWLNLAERIARTRVSSAVSRYGMAMALTPATVGLALLAAAGLPDSFGREDSFWFTFVGSLIAMTGWLWIWRRLIRWTLRRAVGAGSATGIAMINLLVWQPLWQAGCVREDVLRVGQSATLLGLWSGTIVWLLWRSLSTKWTSERLSHVIRNRRQQMSPLVARMITGFALLPFVTGIWAIVGVACDDLLNLSERLSLTVAHTVGAVITIVAWLVIWRASVIWDQASRRGTLIAAAVLLGSACGSPWIPRTGDVTEVLHYVGPLLGAAVWFAASARYWQWREFGTQSIEDRLRCPNCGYCLAGLNQARCPECGSVYTLEELLGYLPAPVG